MKIATIPRVRRLWPAFALLLCLITGGALEAQKCWSCVLGPWAPEGDCVQLLYDGYYECVQTTQYCAGVLPRCFSGSGMLAADGSVYALDDNAGERASGPAAGDEGTGDRVTAQRRTCDGAIVARGYPPDVAADLRRQSRLLRI